MARESMTDAEFKKHEAARKARQGLNQDNQRFSPAFKGGMVGGLYGAMSADSPQEFIANTAVGAAGGKVAEALTNKYEPVKKLVNKGSQFIASHPKVAMATRAIAPIAATAAAADQWRGNYNAVQDIQNNKANARTGYARQILSPIYGLDNFLRSDDKKGLGGYWDAVKEEFNQGADEVARANPDIKAQIAQEEAKRATEQQNTHQTVPQNASWEQQRAAQAQAMAQSVKDNPDNPYAWDAAPGFGAVRGSNGEMKYVVPNEPYNPDKAYEQAMRDQAYQYYMDAISMAGSPFATPERRASELARANSLAQAFGLGLNPDVAAMGGGGGLRAGQLSAEAKNAQALYLKGEENKREQDADIRKRNFEAFKDEPAKGLKVANMVDAQKNYAGVNPLSADDMRKQRVEDQVLSELSQQLVNIGADGATPKDIYKRTPGLDPIFGINFGDLWNSANPIDRFDIDPNYYVKSNGKEYELDDTQFSKGAREYANEVAQKALNQESLNKQYAEYQAKGGNLPFQTWLQQFYMGN